MRKTEGERHKDRPEGRREGGREGRREERQKERKEKKIKKGKKEIQTKRENERKGKKKRKAMSSDLKGWYCILVAMVTESQISKSSRTANRRPHPAQPNLHPSAGTAHRYAHHRISMLNTEDNYLNAFCRDTVFL